MSDPAGARLPVTLLTGFLGSGKTTLLNALLRNEALADTAVIVNEFGEIGLDHLLVERGAEDVVLLNAGCLCCTIGSSLGDTLADLLHRRVRGEVPRFTRVAIETTGLADPAPILALLLTDRVVTAHYGLDGVVTTVDALHGEDQIAAHGEALRQVAVADRLVITKTDLADAETVARLRHALRRLNPAARQVEAVRGAVDLSVLFGIGLYDSSGRPASVRRWIEEAGHAAAHGHAHHDVNRHDARIRAQSVRLGAPTTWAAYAAWLDAMRALPARDLLRVKGLIAIARDPRPYVIQGVQHSFGAPLRLAAWPDADRQGRIVVIGRDLDPAALARAFAALDPANAAA